MPGTAWPSEYQLLQLDFPPPTVSELLHTSEKTEINPIQIHNKVCPQIVVSRSWLNKSVWHRGDDLYNLFLTMHLHDTLPVYILCCEGVQMVKIKMAVIVWFTAFLHFMIPLKISDWTAKSTCFGKSSMSSCIKKQKPADFGMQPQYRRKAAVSVKKHLNLIQTTSRVVSCRFIDKQLHSAGWFPQVWYIILQGLHQADEDKVWGC